MSSFLGVALIQGPGLTTFLILHIWFSKSVRDFNAMILAQDAQRPKLIAETGNAFTSKSSPFYEVPSTDVMQWDGLRTHSWPFLSLFR